MSVDVVRSVTLLPWWYHPCPDQVAHSRVSIAGWVLDDLGDLILDAALQNQLPLIGVPTSRAHPSGVCAGRDIEFHADRAIEVSGRSSSETGRHESGLRLSGPDEEASIAATQFGAEVIDRHETDVS